MAARASRPWRRATVVAVVVHAVLFAFAIRSVRIARPPHEPQAIDLQLVQLRSPPLRLERPRPPRAISLPAQRPAAPALPVPAPVAPAAASVQPLPSDGAADRVRGLLRGSTGCDSARLLGLSDAEQRKCAQWRTAHVDPNLQIPAPIDPVKRSWYEATLQSRRNGRYMPVGPPGRGIMKVPGLPPGHTLFHLGPLAIGLPPGAFNDDEPPPP